MKAAYIEQFGGPEVLRYGDLPDPVPSPGQVVVDVHAASVNGADWKVRVGQYSQAKFPLVLGRDGRRNRLRSIRQHESTTPILLAKGNKGQSPGPAPGRREQ